jgi:hypothetical protein
MMQQLVKLKSSTAANARAFTVRKKIATAKGPLATPPVSVRIAARNEGEDGSGDA